MEQAHDRTIYQKAATMPLDQYVTLGRSGLRVSPLCLGAMTFGEDLGWGTSVEESQQIIDRYTELGGNFIDTANFYTRSHSEKIIGDHIGRHPSRRDRLVIATKFSNNLYSGDPNGGGSGRKALINQCEYSLLERDVEAELVPMAHELGLGITPWSPLKHGLLSGKYTRATAADAQK